MNKFEENEASKDFTLTLSHHTQQYDWDCGLSAVLMVLDERPSTKSFRKICKEEKFDKSIWTIDLCYLLKKLNVKHKYLTKTIGIDSNYQNHDFYNKTLKEDTLRIQQKFLEAEKAGINIKNRIVDYRYLVQHLQLCGPIILLVNHALLCCDLCKVNKLSGEFKSCFGIAQKFIGHYIVLCGFNRNIGRFIFRNPSNNDKLCMISYEKLDCARTDYGTDEDIILIYK